MDHMDEDEVGQLPRLTWTRKLDDEVNKISRAGLTFSDAKMLLPLLFKLSLKNMQDKAKGLVLIHEPLRKWMNNTSHGAPLGGVGAGSIGRSYQGHFQQFQLFPTVLEEKPILANQFSAFVTRPGGISNATVLCTGPKAGELPSDKRGIGSWEWKLEGKNCRYHALYPRSWTVFDGEPDPELRITCRQLSPVIPDNYRESSYPVAVFTFTVHNSGSTPADVTLLFTWANSVGGESELSGNHSNSRMKVQDGVHGVLLHHRTAGEHPPVTFAIAARETEAVRVSECPAFLITGGSRDGFTARDMWCQAKKHGFLDEHGDRASSATDVGSSIGAAVAATAAVPPQGSRAVSFSLAWACSAVRFASGRSYSRRYTRFYGADDDRAAEQLARDALLEHRRWEAEIEEWQRPIVGDTALPEWYPPALFNELYFLNAGGAIWTDGAPPRHSLSAASNRKYSLDKFRITGAPPPSTAEAILGRMDSAADELHRPAAGAFGGNADTDAGVGQFLYLEGIEYRMWNTYDVHFYASFALLAVLPELELSLQRDIAAAVMLHDPEKTRKIDGAVAARKQLGAVPHDVGLNDPWVQLNAYPLHNSDRWKDLNPKFVLQAYRDFAATGDRGFAAAVWPAVYLAVAYMDQFDRDGDGMVENDGTPDQTYDMWPAKGVSAYSGGLWVAALQAASAMARDVGEAGTAEYLWRRYRKARKVYEQQLWNGAYFDYDSSGGGGKLIHADQLAGNWYARACGLEPIVNEDKARAALETVYRHNVAGVRGGKMGAINGVVPGGGGESPMSKEVWAGVTYAVAAAMIHEGMTELGFKTAEGASNTTWAGAGDGHGYSFQTPEAWHADGSYRSQKYMRPLAIWAIQWALQPPLKNLRAPPPQLQDSEAAAAAAGQEFDKVARMLRIPVVKEERGLLATLLAILRHRLLTRD